MPPIENQLAWATLTCVLRPKALTQIILTHYRLTGIAWTNPVVWMQSRYPQLQSQTTNLHFVLRSYYMPGTSSCQRAGGTPAFWSCPFPAKWSPVFCLNLPDDALAGSCSAWWCSLFPRAPSAAFQTPPCPIVSNTKTALPHHSESLVWPASLTNVLRLSLSPGHLLHVQLVIVHHWQGLPELLWRQAWDIKPVSEWAAMAAARSSWRTSHNPLYTLKKHYLFMALF